MEMKIKISIFLVKLCCNLMILAKKPEANWNFAKKMPNYSCGGCCWFLGFTLVALKAHIFHTVGRKYFPLVSFKRAWKNLSEAYGFCPVSFKHGVTVISQSTVKIVFFRCLTNPTLSSCIFQVNGDWKTRLVSFERPWWSFFRNSWIWPSFMKKWCYSDLTKYSEHHFFQTIDPSHFGGSYCSYGWEKIFLVNLKQKSNQNLC